MLDRCRFKSMLKRENIYFYVCGMVEKYEKVTLDVISFFFIYIGHYVLVLPLFLSTLKEWYFPTFLR